MGYSLVIFFSTMMLFVACSLVRAHDGSWLLKTVYVLGIFISSLWISDDSMINFAIVCACGSVIFIIIQILQLLEFVYAWNEVWVTNAQEDPIYYRYLQVATLVSYSFFLMFIILSIVQFAAPGCSFAAAQISWTVIASVGVSLTSISYLSPQGSLLCSSVVSLYASYYCWSALTGIEYNVLNSAGTPCNTLLNADPDDPSNATAVNVIFGLALTCISLAWSAYSTGSHSTDIDPSNRARTVPSHTVPLVNDDNLDNTAPEDSFMCTGDTTLIKPLVLYHFVMLVCTMYMVMTVVDWDVVQTGKKSNLTSTGVWSKALSQWLALALYAWTLVANKVLLMCGVERDFDFS